MSVRVVVCDDSQFMRELLCEALTRQKGVAVVGAAADPYEARELIKATDPDVVTLDIDMPRMDGLTFLDRIMKLRPMPVVMISSHTARGADITIEALERGAVDAMCKPTNLSGETFEAFAREMGVRVRAAARARVTRPLAASRKRPVRRAARSTGPFHKRAVIVLGASTGGVEALGGFLGALPADAPPVAIVQHMPPAYTAQLAQRLDERCAFSVREATDGLALAPGVCVVAPGDRHLELVQDVAGGGYLCRVSDAERVGGHRPAVDVLFASVAQAAGGAGVGVILTGMGQDGAEGLLAMRRAGAATYAQSEASAIVYGMPKAAVNIGAVQHQGDVSELVEWSLAAAAGQDGVDHAQSA